MEDGVKVNHSIGDNKPVGSSDPFEHLHKMSTTAGLGSGDYVAINGTAIVAILLGVGSAIVLFNSWLLLAIPLLGVICAVLAFRQISESNKTQTGAAIAAVGLLLSLGFGGFYTVKTWYDYTRHQSDEREIVSTIKKFGNLVKSRDYTTAHQLLDTRLADRVPEPIFEGTLSHVTTSTVLGDLQDMDWNQMLEFKEDPVTGDRIADGMVKLKYANSPEPLRVPMSFRNSGGKWQFDQIPQFFPESSSAQQPQKPGRGPSSPGPLGPPKP